MFGELGAGIDQGTAQDSENPRLLAVAGLSHTADNLEFGGRLAGAGMANRAMCRVMTMSKTALL